MIHIPVGCLQCFLYGLHGNIIYCFIWTNPHPYSGSARGRLRRPIAPPKVAEIAHQRDRIWQISASKSRLRNYICGISFRIGMTYICTSPFVDLTAIDQSHQGQWLVGPRCSWQTALPWEFLKPGGFFKWGSPKAWWFQYWNGLPSGYLT